MVRLSYYIYNNYIYVKGDNSYGQLGINSNKKYVNKYTRIPIHIKKKYLNKCYIEFYEYDYINFFCINNKMYYAGWKYEFTNNINDFHTIIKKIKKFFNDGN